MPPRAAPGDREAIEAALRSADRRALVRQCERLRIPRDRWQEVAALQWTYETLAVLQLATRLKAEAGNGRSSTREAIEAAARQLDVSAETVRTRMKRLPGS